MESQQGIYCVMLRCDGCTLGSLVDSMLHHMTEAQVLETWLVLEMTITGRELTWTNTRGGVQWTAWLPFLCDLQYNNILSLTAENHLLNESDLTHLDVTLQSCMLKHCHKLNDVELFSDSHTILVKEGETCFTYTQVLLNSLTLKLNYDILLLRSV